MSELSTFLKERRVQLKMRQHQISKSLGYEQNQSISNWERGTVTPPTAKLRDYAKVLKTPYKKIVDLVLSDYKTELNKRPKK